MVQWFIALSGMKIRYMYMCGIFHHYLYIFPCYVYRGLHSIWSKTSSGLCPVLLIRIAVVVFNSHRFTRGNSAAEHNKMVM